MTTWFHSIVIIHNCDWIWVSAWGNYLSTNVRMSRRKPLTGLSDNRSCSCGIVGVTDDACFAFLIDRRWIRLWFSRSSLWWTKSCIPSLRSTFARCQIWHVWCGHWSRPRYLSLHRVFFKCISTRVYKSKKGTGFMLSRQMFPFFGRFHSTSSSVWPRHSCSFLPSIGPTKRLLHPWRPWFRLHFTSILP